MRRQSREPSVEVVLPQPLKMERTNTTYKNVSYIFRPAIYECEMNGLAYQLFVNVLVFLSELVKVVSWDIVGTFNAIFLEKF
jgi:hypothetical protein